MKHEAGQVSLSGFAAVRKKPGISAGFASPLAGAACIFVEDQIIQIRHRIAAQIHICFSFPKVDYRTVYAIRRKKCAGFS
ncbi:MAG: hypothetical protein ACI4PH_01045 [Faecousia sp.]